MSIQFYLRHVRSILYWPVRMCLFAIVFVPDLYDDVRVWRLRHGSLFQRENLRRSWYSTAIMAWSCTGTTNAELISNLLRNKLINSDAVAAVRAPLRLNCQAFLPHANSSMLSLGDADRRPRKLRPRQATCIRRLAPVRGPHTPT